MTNNTATEADPKVNCLHRLDREVERSQRCCRWNVRIATVVAAVLRGHRRLSVTGRLQDVAGVDTQQTLVGHNPLAAFVADKGRRNDRRIDAIIVAPRGNSSLTPVTG